MFTLIDLPESYNPATWPAGYVLVAVIAAFWLLKNLAEGLSSIKTIRDSGLGFWDWFKGVFITSRQQAAAERKAIRAEMSEIKDQNAQLLKEFRPNGGETFKDGLVRIEGNLEKVTDKVESTAAWIHHQKETSETPIFILDGEGRMTFANCAFREMVNAELSDLLEMNYLSRMEARDRKRFIDELAMATANKIPFDIIVHYKREGPHYVAVRMQATADQSDHQNLKNFFGSACEIDSPEAIHHSQA